MTELLSLEALRQLPDDIMKVEGNTCIYFLWDTDVLLYIGASIHASERIAKHIRERNYNCAWRGSPMPFNRYTVLEVGRRQLWKLENEYLHRYETPYNEPSHQRRRW